MVVYSPRILSLCAGYGGLELAVELVFMGAGVVCYVEREVYAAANLVARFHDKALYPAPVWDDVTTFDGRPWCEKVDWIVGGYPCQPASVAGKRRGTKDSRFIWPAVARIVDEVRPKVCFFENVANHLNLGFYEVARDLQSLGYEVAATLVTAEEVGASQKRERLFVFGIISDSDRFAVRYESERGQQKTAERRVTLPTYSSETVADTNGHGLLQKRCITTKDINLTPGDHDFRSGGCLANPDGNIGWCQQQSEDSSEIRRTESQGNHPEFPLADSVDVHHGGHVPGGARREQSKEAELSGCQGRMGDTNREGHEGSVQQYDGPYNTGWLFPPGRNDWERWGQLLHDHPEICPAISRQWL